MIVGGLFILCHLSRPTEEIGKADVTEEVVGKSTPLVTGMRVQASRERLVNNNVGNFLPPSWDSRQPAKTIPIARAKWSGGFRKGA